MRAVAAAVRLIPDFPQPGIQFRDITPLIADARAFALAVELMTARARAFAPDIIVAAEARGFLFGAPLALALGVGLVPVRKPGKLPAAVHEAAYGLEYGSDRLQIHADAAHPGRVLLGTEEGVYLSRDAAVSWQRAVFPAVSVLRLAQSAADARLLLAGTQGRGV